MCVCLVLLLWCVPYVKLDILLTNKLFEYEFDNR